MRRNAGALNASKADTAMVGKGPGAAQPTHPCISAAEGARPSGMPSSSHHSSSASSLQLGARAAAGRARRAAATWALKEAGPHAVHACGQGLAVHSRAGLNRWWMAVQVRGTSA